MNCRFLFVMTALIAISAVTGAQNKEEESEKLSKRYDLVVSKLGYDGVGVETILNEWEKVDSLNQKMLVARYNYYLTKSQDNQVVTKDSDKYLGMNPLLSLKDSTGKSVYYYQETFYDDSLFSMAMKSLDKVISVYPDRVDLRFMKAASLVSYEKDSPDMALSVLSDIIDMDAKGTKKWEYPGQEMTGELFRTVIQEYCQTFYLIGSMSSYEAFRKLSEKMNSIYPKDPVFLSNLGSYYFVVAKDYKTAGKYYDKALKANPDFYPAISNCILMARRSGNLKSERKYLKMMVEHGPENESKSARIRLSALEKKK